MTRLVALCCDVCVVWSVVVRSGVERRGEGRGCDVEECLVHGWWQLPLTLPPPLPPQFIQYQHESSCFPASLLFLHHHLHPHRHIHIIIALPSFLHTTFIPPPHFYQLNNQPTCLPTYLPNYLSHLPAYLRERKRETSHH